jgi:hypothetical protein
MLNFNASIIGESTDNIQCRVYDPIQGLWLNNSNWSNVTNASLTNLTYKGGNRWGGVVQYESTGNIIEYLNNGDYIGEDDTKLVSILDIKSVTDVLPTNPLLSTDSRLNRLDANISTRSTFNGGPVASVVSPVTVGTNNDKTGYSGVATNMVVSPDNTSISTILSSIQNTTYGLNALLNAITAIKTKTDKLGFDTNNQLNVNASVNLDTTDLATSSQLADSTNTILRNLGVRGAGTIAVDHDFPTVDNLRYIDTNGSGIDNGIILVYLTSDYMNGNNTINFIKGTSSTKMDGRWIDPIYLDSGLSFTIVFYKQGAFSITTKEITT